MISTPKTRTAAANALARKGLACRSVHAVQERRGALVASMWPTSAYAADARSASSSLLFGGFVAAVQVPGPAPIRMHASPLTLDHESSTEQQEGGP